jgi:hypothetical protein
MQVRVLVYLPFCNIWWIVGYLGFSLNSDDVSNSDSWKYLYAFILIEMKL